MTKHSAPSSISRLFCRAAETAALTLCLSAGSYAQDQQEQQSQQQDQEQAQQQGQQAERPQPQPADRHASKPTYASQDADKPPYSRDHRSMSVKNASEPPPQSDQPTQAPQPSQPIPGTLTVPAGTVLVIRTTDFLSSDTNKAGDPFTATLDQPLVVNGWVIARRGQTLIGKVKDAKKAGRIKGTSELEVELTDLTVVDGRQLPILTELWKGSGGTSHGQDAGTIVGTTGLGAAIGAAADWGTGAAIGAGAGLAAGIGAVLLTRGRPTIVEPESLLSFRLVDSLKVDTTQSQQAFLPVTQQDFGMERRGPRRVAGAYPGPYYPCGYYGPCYGYPYPYVGFYGAYGYYGRGYYGHRGFRY
ncbi:MAG TPA: hypothetical protein VJO16_17510 [Candidatus Acidoferrum sp.]|nr:hypothetical protein [Candidatus Acidoferrum sp.]